MEFELGNIWYTLSAASEKGSRSYQEDNYFAKASDLGFWFGVFDGHGGDEVSSKLRELILHEKIDLNELDTQEPHPVKKMKELFRRLNLHTQHMESGSTGSVVYIPKHGNYVIVGVIGDSPVVVKHSDSSYWKAPEHNVRTNSIEADRAIERGGFISNGYLFDTYDGGGLQMARAFGDAHLDRVLARYPDVIHVTNPEWIMVASDGVIDPSHQNSNNLEDVIKLVEEGKEANDLVKRAVDIDTGDNATAMLVRVVK